MKTLLLEELDRVRTDDAARHRVAEVLRWIYQDLLPEPASCTPKPPRRLIRPLRPAWLLPSHSTRAGGVRA